MEANRNDSQNASQQGGAGRIQTDENGSQPQEGQRSSQVRDISEIDQQEGSMNHGTKGGNFDSDAEGKENKDRL